MSSASPPVRRRSTPRDAAARLGLLLLLGFAALGCERPPLAVVEPPIEIERETIGSGAAVSDGMIACIAWRISHLDGRELMSDDETCLTVGGGNVIDGLARTMEGMRAGGSRTVLLPPHTHWGSAGHGPIPPGTTLRLTVAVHSIHPPGWRPPEPPAGRRLPSTR